MAATTFLNLPGGLKMPTIGLGTWQAEQAKEPDELARALNTALEVGYRHIDTALVYETETIIGTVLKQWLDSGRLKRSDLFITTKLPMVGVNPDRVAHYLHKSLGNLQLDYVDLYLVHFPVGCTPDPNGGDWPPVNAQGRTVIEPTDHIAVWKKMEEQVDAGLAKTIGLSNFNVKQITKVLKSARIKPAILQVELHVFLQQRELVDFCQKNGISVVAYSPLGSPEYNKFLTKIGQKDKVLPNMLNDAVIKNIAAKHSKSPAQVMLRYLLQRNIAAIPKSVIATQIKENINVFDFELEPDDVKTLNGLEVGETARVCDFKIYPGIEKHPEYPIK